MFTFIFLSLKFNLFNIEFKKTQIDIINLIKFDNFLPFLRTIFNLQLFMQAQQNTNY